MVGPVQVVGFPDDDPGSPASWSAPVGSEEPRCDGPSSTSRNDVKGATPEVVRRTSTANTAVLVNRTSARSRPASNDSEEPEEVDGGVVGEVPPFCELVDGVSDISQAHTTVVVRVDANRFREPTTSKRSSIDTASRW